MKNGYKGEMGHTGSLTDRAAVSFFFFSKNTTPRVLSGSATYLSLDIRVAVSERLRAYLGDR
jgi:hypothetical protein